MPAPKFTPSQTKVYLFSGTDAAEIERLENEARFAAQVYEAERKKAEKGADRLLHETGPEELAEEAKRAAEEHDKFVQAARKRATLVTLQALGRRRYRSLVAEHPPREGNETDKAMAVNEETFGDVLVPESIVDPKFPIPSDRDDFLDSLSLVQFTRLYVEAYKLNNNLAADPKASLRSELSLS